MSVTPLRLALKSFIFELNDSAFTFVCLLVKKFKMFSRLYFTVFATYITILSVTFTEDAPSVLATLDKAFISSPS